MSLPIGAMAVWQEGSGRCHVVTVMSEPRSTSYGDIQDIRNGAGLIHSARVDMLSPLPARVAVPLVWRRPRFEVVT